MELLVFCMDVDYWLPRKAKVSRAGKFFFFPLRGSDGEQLLHGHPVSSHGHHSFSFFRVVTILYVLYGLKIGLALF